MANLENIPGLCGVNIGKPNIKVKHADLEKVSDESDYKVKCPACKEGLLLVRRYPIDLELSKYDNCILCGQSFEYGDLGK